MKKEINWTKWGTIIALISFLWSIWNQYQIHQNQGSIISLNHNYDILAQSSTVIQQEFDAESSTIANIVKSRVGGSVNSPNSPTVNIQGPNNGPVANGQNASAIQSIQNNGPKPFVLSVSPKSVNILSTQGYEQEFDIVIGYPTSSMVLYIGVAHFNVTHSLVTSGIQIGGSQGSLPYSEYDVTFFTNNLINASGTDLFSIE